MKIGLTFKFEVAGKFVIEGGKDCIKTYQVLVHINQCLVCVFTAGKVYGAKCSC